MAPSSSVETDNSIFTEDPMDVRKWLSTNYPKQLSLLDKFEIDLRLGRFTPNSSTATVTASGGNQQQVMMMMHGNISLRLYVTLRTLDLLRNIIGSTRWKNAAQLLTLLRGLGRELHAVGGYKEPVIENIVRRIMAAVREEISLCSEEAQQQEQEQQSSTATQPTKPQLKLDSVSGRLTMHSMLWALPQHVKTSRSPSLRGDFAAATTASEADPNTELSSSTNYPPNYYVNRPDLKGSVMENIQEITTELEDLQKNINDQATNHIHAGEVILTYGRSKTVEYFLKAAAENFKRKFQVVVCEGAPSYGGHELAKSLADSGIDTIVINDSATFAIMARVNKVLLPAHAVLANGGLVTSSGCNMVALCAHNNSVPVVCLTGMFKLCPMYPHEGQDTLNELLNPSSILDYNEVDNINNNKFTKQVELINPLHDYIKPEHINLYVTNVGSFQPSYIYRLLAEYYHSDDWEPFE